MTISDIISKRPEDRSDEDHAALVKEFNRATKKVKVLKKALREPTGVDPIAGRVRGDVLCQSYNTCYRNQIDTPDCRQGGCRAWGG